MLFDTLGFWGYLRIWSFLFQVWEEAFGVNIIDAVRQQIYDASQLADDLVTESKTAKRIGFIGLGAMGFGMASHFLKSGFSVVAYDVRIRWIFLSFPTA
jgi:phosphoglycerate dehydrogenase-like enzyme